MWVHLQQNGRFCNKRITKEEGKEGLVKMACNDNQEIDGDGMGHVG